MPSGSKKRKASKKKKSSNPNSGPPSPNLLPVAHPGNGHVSTEDEGEEMFETPRSQPDPVDLLLVKGSSDRVPVKKAESSAVDENLATMMEESSQFYEARAENPEASIEQEAKVMPCPAVRPEIAVDEVNVDEVDGNGEAKEVNQIDEGLKVTVSDRVAEDYQIDEGLKVTVSDRVAEDYTAIENSSPVTDVVENQDTFVEEGDKIDADDHVKEMNDGLKEIDLDRLAEEKYTHIDDMNVVTQESSIGVGVAEDHDSLVEEVNVINVDGEPKEMSTEENYTPIENSALVIEESLVILSEKDEAMVDEIVVVGDGGEAKELPHVDESLKDAHLDKLVEENYTLTEHCTVVTEEVSQQSEATAENLNKILVGIVDTSLPGKEVEVLAAQEVGEPSARTEISPRSEVARGPLVVRRATLWNCCGLLDVFTGSER